MQHTSERGRGGTTGGEKGVWCVLELVGGWVGGGWGSSFSLGAKDCVGHTKPRIWVVIILQITWSPNKFGGLGFFGVI